MYFRGTFFILILKMNNKLVYQVVIVNGDETISL